MPHVDPSERFESESDASGRALLSFLLAASMASKRDIDEDDDPA
jgi:hypothetical protein